MKQKAAGGLTPRNQIHRDATPAGSRQRVRRNEPLVFTRLNAGFMGLCISIQGAMQESPNHWKRRVGFPKRTKSARWTSHPLRRALRSPRSVPHAKDGISGEQCKDLQLKGPNEQSAKALQGRAGLGHLSKTGRGSLYCYRHYSEDK